MTGTGERRFWRIPTGAAALRKRVAGRLYDALSMRDPFALARLDFLKFADDSGRTFVLSPVSGS